MTFRTKLAMALLACLLALPLPALAGKTAQYSGRFAAKYPAVAEARSLGVLRFAGRDGDAFAAVLTGSLQSAEIDGQQVLAVKTIEGMNYKGGDDLSRAEIAAAIQLGRKLNVKAVMTGTITSAAVNSENYTRTESVCLRSRKLFKCDEATTRQVHCTKVTGQYSVTPRVILVSNGSLLYSESVSAQDGYTTCGGQAQAETVQEAFSGLGALIGRPSATPVRAATPEELLQRLRASVAEQIRQHVVPYNKTVTVTFRDDMSQLPKPTQASLRNALDFAQAGRMDRACSILETMMDDTLRQNVTMLYNLGVCQEVLLPEDPSAALEYYAKADQLMNKPDKLVSAAYLRTKAMASSERSISRSLTVREAAPGEEAAVRTATPNPKAAGAKPASAGTRKTKP